MVFGALGRISKCETARSDFGESWGQRRNLLHANLKVLWVLRSATRKKECEGTEVDSGRRPATFFSTEAKDGGEAN